MTKPKSKRTIKFNRTKVSRKGLVKKLDDIWSLYIRKRDKRCVVCGTQNNLTCGHLFSRVSYSTRWDPRNTWGQCSSCNYLHESDPYPFTRWFQRKFGLKAYDELHKKYWESVKYTDQQLIDMYEQIKQMLDELE
jgi:hypothetical protein